MTTVTDFPVVWDDPADAELTWLHDNIHSPEPATPLGGAFAEFASHGFAEAFRQYSVPAVFRSRIVNHWGYNAFHPADLSPDELGRMMGEVEARVGAAVARLGELWDETYLPEIKEHLKPFEEFDLASASLDELAEQFALRRQTAQRLMEIHFLAIIPAYVAVSEFDELYRKLFDDADPHDSYRLLQGIGNMTVDTGIALWELSRTVRETPEVRRAIEEEDGNALSAVEAVEGGTAFLAKLHDYLEFYGHRGDKWDISFPSWVEDPTPVLKSLRDYLAKETHPAVELQNAAVDRARLIESARERITDDGARGGFDFLLAAAEKGIVITEDHNFWIDNRGMHEVRRICVELGRRFAEAGVLEDPDDVFFLLIDEIDETIRALPELDRRELVRSRRASFEHAKTITPPPFIGAPPVEEEGPSNPIQLAFGKMFGGPPPAQDYAEGLRGFPGSTGVARGTARIITTIADADRLQPGDVLVAQATAPPWTPLFAVAGAIVTDSGGILSHCAVVAREYQIPAVVGCGNATTAIRDGQTVEVDGTTGTVRLL
jgi:phosphohistidine swiveling domain-containing protein